MVLSETNALQHPGHRCNQLWHRRIDWRSPSQLPCDLDPRNRSSGSRYFSDSVLNGGYAMKVVIWRSPKYLTGILRRAFGIDRSE